MAAKLNTTIRRWCETCGRFTRSALDDEGYEICAEHVEPGGGWRRIPTTAFTPGCETWQRDVKDGHLTVIVGQEPNVGWHLSISHRTNHNPPRPGRNPKWNEIKDARYRFTPPDVTMCMILPPPDEYVNVHETTFHLWEHGE